MKVNMHQLPKTPFHPEPHTYTWSKLELAAIEAYGKACFEAGKETVEPTTTDKYELVAAFSGFYGGRPVIDVLDASMILPTGTSLYWRISVPKEST